MAQLAHCWRIADVSRLWSRRAWLLAINPAAFPLAPVRSRYWSVAIAGHRFRQGTSSRPVFLPVYAYFYLSLVLLCYKGTI